MEGIGDHGVLTFPSELLSSYTMGEQEITVLVCIYNSNPTRLDSYNPAITQITLIMQCGSSHKIDGQECEKQILMVEGVCKMVSGIWEWVGRKNGQYTWYTYLKL